MTNKYKIYLISFLIICILAIFVSAHEEADFAKAEQIIKQKVPCDNLTLDDLKTIGEYYMEQMHPGELHEIMDERMGGEGSSQLKQMHIAMGNAFYCGESQSMSPAMMNMMMGRGMMGSGSMMGGYTGNFYNINWLIGILLLVILLLVILLIKQLQKKNIPRRK